MEPVVDGEEQPGRDQGHERVPQALDESRRRYRAGLVRVAEDRDGEESEGNDDAGLQEPVRERLRVGPERVYVWAFATLGPAAERAHSDSSGVGPRLALRLFSSKTASTAGQNFRGVARTQGSGLTKPWQGLGTPQKSS